MKDAGDLYDRLKVLSEHISTEFDEILEDMQDENWHDLVGGKSVDQKARIKM